MHPITNVSIDDKYLNRFEKQIHETGLVVIPEPESEGNVSFEMSESA